MCEQINYTDQLLECLEWYWLYSDASEVLIMPYINEDSPRISDNPYDEAQCICDAAHRHFETSSAKLRAALHRIHIRDTSNFQTPAKPIKIQSTATIKLEARLPVQILKQGAIYSSYCPILDVAAQGNTPEGAEQAIREAVKAFFVGCYEMGTLTAIMKDISFIHDESNRGVVRPSGWGHITVSLMFVAD